MMHEEIEVGHPLAQGGQDDAGCRGESHVEVRTEGAVAHQDASD